MDLVTTCTCACSYCASPCLWRRSVKRKLDQVAGGGCGGAGGPHLLADVAVRVEVENEVAALREALGRQQRTIQELCVELDEERNAASTAANEAMSMILRLQREKAEVQMESRQYKRFAEEKMAHDQQELIALDDLLLKRDLAVQSLSSEVKGYKYRLLSCGIEDLELKTLEADDEAIATPRFDPNDEYDYPPLRCAMPGNLDNDDETGDLEKYTPRTLDHIQNLEQRIYQLETTPGSSQVKVMEKEVVGPGSEPEFDTREEFPVVVDCGLEDSNGDDGSDRVYTIDAVHGVPTAGVSDEDEYESVSTKGKEDDDDCKGEAVIGKVVADDGDMQKLYMRLQALEADRESMRQAIISMRTEKAQLVLLKEIAQHLCKEVAPETRAVKKPSVTPRVSIASAIKWIMSFIFWRKKASRSKFTFGTSDNNVGLLLLLDRSPRMNQWRSLSKTQR